MRALLGIVLAVAGLWAGYWWVGSSAVERGAVDWFAAQEAKGMVARNGGIAVSGFPNRFDLTVTAPELANPAQGIGWSAPFAQVFAMTWKPWHIIAALPQEQTLRLPGQDVTITSTRLPASIAPRSIIVSLHLQFAVDAGRLAQGRSAAGLPRPPHPSKEAPCQLIETIRHCRAKHRCLRLPVCLGHPERRTNARHGVDAPVPMGCGVWGQIQETTSAATVTHGMVHRPCAH